MPKLARTNSSRRLLALACFSLALPLAAAHAQPGNPQRDLKKLPWMNKSLSADQRADLMIHEMTLDEKIQLVHGDGWGVLRYGDYVGPTHNLGAGFVPGIPRLGLPDINLADSAVGIRGAARQSRYATVLPSVIGLAASWDPEAARLYGSVIGRELRDEGFNMSIGGGVDLIREPRNGRNFEYASEDPVLSGIIVGQLASGVQDNHIMGDIKHYVLNDQETGRNSLNAVLNRRAMQETDLLAFQIAIKLAKPAGVMCSYNRVNGDFACENDYTLNQVLKKGWGFQGFVLSDWDGTHSTTKAALAGLDMEQPGAHDGSSYFGTPLKEAVQSGQVPPARLDDAVHRIVRSMFGTGSIDEPPVRQVVDPFRGRDDARHIESESLVLLKNEHAVLPLQQPGRIAIIGAHADVGVLSGGGSAQVDSPGGNVVNPHPGGAHWQEHVFIPSSPLRSIKELAPAARITFNPGTDPGSAAQAAKGADVVLFFAEQWMSEGQDAQTSSLPGNQNAVIEAVARANPNTVVILETGGSVTMPWAGQVAGIVESWFPGIGGAEAIADVLFGKVNPSGKLPVTFAASDADLPHPHVTGLTENVSNNGMNGAGTRNQPKNFDVDYNVEGMEVGYKWFEARHKQPLFAFGHGLSYTTFSYSNLKVAPQAAAVDFTINNTGTRQGDEIAQVYATLPTAAGEPFRRLIGFKRVSLAPGASQTVQIPIDPLYLEIYTEQGDTFHRLAGDYKLEVGGSSAAPALTLHQTLALQAN